MLISLILLHNRRKNLKWKWNPGMYFNDNCCPQHTLWVLTDSDSGKDAKSLLSSFTWSPSNSWTGLPVTAPEKLPQPSPASSQERDKKQREQAEGRWALWLHRERISMMSELFFSLFPSKLFLRELLSEKRAIRVSAHWLLSLSSLPLPHSCQPCYQWIILFLTLKILQGIQVSQKLPTSVQTIPILFILWMFYIYQVKYKLQTLRDSLKEDYIFVLNVFCVTFFLQPEKQDVR